MIQQVALGQKGLRVSEFIAGFWRLQHWQMSPAALQAYLEDLLELGITTMDHAHVYRSEALFGEVLKSSPGLRERMQIITKCGIRVPGFGPLGAEAVVHYDSSATAIEASVHQSLKDLNVEQVDLLLLHRPDYLMAADEAAEAFTRLQQAGKVAHFGVSNFSTAQFAELHSVWPALATNQVEFSPCALQALDSGVFNQCATLGIRPMLWSCLGGGRLLNPDDERGRSIHRALTRVCDALGAPSLEAVVYAWLRSPACGPLPLLGTSSLARVKKALMATDISLSREQWYAIWEAANGAPVP